ncbi:MAG: hypothetical protein M3P26_01985 [Gemmatimonadota bacterium]|nr:hypothetical protein [Gemmatimonadota bacterium]
MQTTIRTSSLVLWGLILVGCAEAIAPRRDAQGYGDLAIAIPHLAALRQSNTKLRVSHMLVAGDSSGYSTPTYGTTPSWVTNQSPGLIDLHWTDAGFVDSTNAYGMAYMKYWATNADQTVTMGLRYNNSSVGSNTSRDAADDLVPWSRELRSVTSMGINARCGFLVDATGTHSVGMKFIASGAQGWLEWGKSTVSDTHSAAQAACTTNTGGGGTGGGGGGYVVCYYYSYYDSAGNYLGDSEKFGCYYTHELG